eukprot:TRINITY_DN4398_c0_g1_i1.p1 TRINITY_DN4398_c0_g1~~TRINITY_DN4398_c0_g1_i1.p1  ORF type:complete len:300 (+),score=36.11 TRINITY_DN4398_c0_g1_i1:35-901(+)
MSSKWEKHHSSIFAIPSVQGDRDGQRIVEAKASRPLISYKQKSNNNSIDNIENVEVEDPYDFTKYTKPYFLQCEADERLYCPLYYLLKLLDMKTPVNTYDFDHLRCGGRFQKIRKKYLPVTSATLITFDDLYALAHEPNPCLKYGKPSEKPDKIHSNTLVTQEGYRIHDFMWELTERGKKIAIKAKNEKWIRTQRKTSKTTTIVPPVRKKPRLTAQNSSVSPERSLDAIKSLDLALTLVQDQQVQNDLLHTYTSLLEPLAPAHFQLHMETTLEGKIKRLIDLRYSRTC